MTNERSIGGRLAWKILFKEWLKHSLRVDLNGEGEKLLLTLVNKKPNCCFYSTFP